MKVSSLTTAYQILRIIKARATSYSRLEFSVASIKHQTARGLVWEPTQKAQPCQYSCGVVISSIHSKTACRGFKSFCPCQTSCGASRKKDTESLDFTGFSVSFCFAKSGIQTGAFILFCPPLHPLYPLKGCQKGCQNFRRSVFPGKVILPLKLRKE